MLKFYNFDVVFQEVPDEVSLAVNLTGCPNGCKGCHSPHLMGDIGEPLDEARIDALVAQYEGLVTCFCFMGGDREPAEVCRLAAYLRAQHPGLKIAWYSGKPELYPQLPAGLFHYVKVGPYMAEYGGLDKPGTNQRFYKVEADGSLTNLTHRFRK